jgi:hypothetical protein
LLSSDQPSIPVKQSYYQGHYQVQFRWREVKTVLLLLLIPNNSGQICLMSV